MVRPQQSENSAKERIDEYLRSFKSQNSTFTSADAAGETSIDEYLLERAAQELRIAQAQIEEIKRESGKD